MTKRIGVGQFFAWEGGCLFIGHHDRPLPLHAHQSMQFVVASAGDHKVRASDREPWATYSIAAIGTRQPHSIDVTASDYGAVIFVEPETRNGRAITQRCASGITEVGTSALREISDAMFGAWLHERKDETVANARRLVTTLGATVDSADVTDPRIMSAIVYINQHLDRAITLNEVASYACLSPSRFRHVFGEQTGMGLRPYILWRRFLLVWELLMNGRNLSEAAHAAGFADAAHLTRTSVKAFGFAPSGIQLLATPDPKAMLAESHPKST
ncbi:MAG: helix-turn-helix domain-containing protein [Gemmatimonadaceae bacterium]|nr:helix-turn-helix domain-containing protein [Gemmatimonadaceae bacterium]